MTRTIAVPLPPSPAAAAAVRRWWDAGDAVLPLDPDISATGLAAVVTALRPDRVATIDDPDGRAAPDPLPTPAGTALVVTTSGSTGAPKGVVLSAAALAASTRASLARLGGSPGEVWRVPLPLHHVAGLAALRRGWASGTEPEVVAPGDLEALRRGGADHVALVPTQLRRWLDRGPDDDVGDGPRHVLLGGAAAPPELLTRARAAGLRVVTSYGMTETCGGCVYDGRPLDGVTVEVTDDGRLRIRGPVLADGYRGLAPGDPAAAAFTDAGFTTGDLGAVADDGHVTVFGRADDVAITGGENVPLSAVTAALCGHPAVADAVATAVPDPEWGQRIVAVVVAADAAQPPSLEELRDHVRTQQPAPFAPRELRLVAALPRDAMGKLRRDQLPT